MNFQDEEDVQENIKAISQPALKRIMQRAGILRISVSVYEKLRDIMGKYIKSVIKDIVVIVDHDNKKTLNSNELYKIQNFIYPVYAFHEIFSLDANSFVYKIEPLSGDYIQTKIERMKNQNNFEIFYFSFDGIYNYYFQEIENSKNNNDQENSIKLLNEFENYTNAQIIFLENLTTYTQSKIQNFDSDLSSLFNTIQTTERFLDLTIQKYNQAKLYDNAQVLIDKRNHIHNVILEENKEIVSDIDNEMELLFADTKDHESLAKYRELKSFLEDEISYYKSTGK